MSNANRRAADPLQGEHASEASTSAKEGAFPHIESMLSAAEVRQTFGVVESCEGAAVLVRAGAEVIHARRAKGCLLEPAKGDNVLVARSEHHGSFVLSVLVSADDKGDSVLAVEGNLTLRSKSGQVAILGSEGVSLTSGREVAVNAPEVAVRTMKATLFADSLSYVGRTIEVVGQVLETAFDRVTARMKHSYRTIDELERVKAGEINVTAEGTLNMHGKNALVTAEKIVKLDGEQIQIG